MAPKRKKPTMALMQQDLPTIEEHSPPITPGFANPPPRRSRRNVRKSSGMDGYPIGEKENTESVNGHQDVKEDKPPGRAKVSSAMHDLQEMEDAFRKSAKRQKLAVKSSAVMNKKFNGSPTDAGNAFMPDMGQTSSVLSDDDTLEFRRKEQAKKHGVDPEVPQLEQDAAVGEGEMGQGVDPEDVSDLKEEGARPPAVNSDYLPLPWKGRLGYACLNTYLRLSNPPVFSSRTCRIASILEHRHPLSDPSQPEHATKNRPDKDQPADVARGQRYVENLGLANARDIVKMLRWNDKYGIKFMRLSSEMFPFASHGEYGYKLAPFAADALAEAGRVAGELGHRLTTHPGQFTQLGSPRKEVVRNAIRDLEYHDEMLSLLKLPPQQNKDAVMILHMGGMFGDKEATLQRFRDNYAPLSEGIKARLVLENDDVCWTVHDLLPICEELNIPMVLDYHHHNIMFDKSKIREGTKDIMDLYPRIKATWDRKGITQKMHYSEPCPEAITGRQRRKHRPRVMALPPCADNMDLMIEAKDKEQAVFELMRTYKLPGWDSFNDIVPYERNDENKPPPKPKTPKKRKAKGKKETDEDDEAEPEESEVAAPPLISPGEIGMGGPNRRVYWPIGMEEWLRPKKREVKKAADGDNKKPKKTKVKDEGGYDE
ncbi:hypothetical protein PFICI_04122 [Pestalotiopsis fici W106-1]|uniref:UV-damage endonuclease n=1 Tax=Pestalotiopsis fici (strain W106-1 / CGMCC3.15140) TaxID=1229662 RepID=W3XKV1_PESFW|nr:uncharacterized protein PFICI_04122 [Pestalotiopsis fici W106-1]ETS86097.1 hypothetical protein PFICI_04122 [Pestalotiopsis fici W106-1]